MASKPTPKETSNLYATVDAVPRSIQTLFDEIASKLPVSGKDEDDTRPRTSRLQVKQIAEINNQKMVTIFKKQWDVYKKKASQTQGGRFQKIEETKTRSLSTDGLDTKCLKVEAESCDQAINEVYLFYSADDTVLGRVVKHGFSDEAKLKTLGDAVHLTESPDIADSYAGNYFTKSLTNITSPISITEDPSVLSSHPFIRFVNLSRAKHNGYVSYRIASADEWYKGQKTGRRMLLVRVILGRTYNHRVTETPTLPSLPCTKKGCMQPGCKEHTNRFDSALVRLKRGHRVILMFDTDRCIPEFIITYDST